ncbi:MAG: GNAT family N-acetyltransferase [Acidiferrobacterales bacterium]
MHLNVINSIAEIPAPAWDALVGDTNPFVKHAFLSALEQTDCTTAKAGWAPCHLALYADASQQGHLLGAVPMYLKSHSYGEYVFDWAWADAYERAGLRYYPKLVAAVPFTPVSGPRLLTADHESEQIRQHLISGAVTVAKQMQVSSLHWLFAPETDVAALADAGHLRRTGCQFHWHNPGYASFEQFLAELASAKRKKIKQERRYVREAGVTIEVLSDDSITPRHWDAFYEFYLSTIHCHGAIPYLTRDFFHCLGSVMSNNAVLVLARQDGQPVAGALNMRGSESLYGRYWGTHKNISGLHFEVCYYAAMEYCIERGLTRFEAGAQGEHKLARGFLPVTTHSAHWLSHPQFSQAVAQFLRKEHHGLRYYIDELNEHSPFKQDRAART